MDYKKIFIDSDIILDVFMQREPFSRASQVLLNVSKTNIVTSALVIANVHYFIKKHTNKNTAKTLIKEIAEIIEILPFGKENILSAANSDHADFEDSIQYHIAIQHNCDIIITRNIKDYKHSAIPVLTAEQFLRKIL
jgi:predicted nucleic acid-binding protein